MKLTAKELRIGNLIYRENNVIATCSAVTIDYVKKAPQHFSGIPLTEEWLLRMGAISNPYKDRYELGDLHFECDKTKGETILWCEKYPHIKFVHQVQNYIYATTGEELTIKELK